MLRPLAAAAAAVSLHNKTEQRGCGAERREERTGAALSPCSEVGQRRLLPKVLVLVLLWHCRRPLRNRSWFSTLHWAAAEADAPPALRHAPQRSFSAGPEGSRTRLSPACSPRAAARPAPAREDVTSAKVAATIRASRAGRTRSAHYFGDSLPASPASLLCLTTASAYLCRHLPAEKQKRSARACVRVGKSGPAKAADLHPQRGVGRVLRPGAVPVQP